MTKRSKPASSPTARFSVSALEKLASSGLTADHGAALQMRTLAPHETKLLHPSLELREALYIPYFDPETGEQFDPPFWRIRYLGEVASAFGEVSEKKPRRYMQAPGTGMYAYFPPLFDWADVLADAAQPLFITEGELKAAKACVEQYLCIGVGGVFNFGTKDELLPELEAVNWHGRRVYIIYDSDAATNPNVRLALARLGTALANRRAITYEVRLPPGPDGAKVGLDDYLLLEHADLDTLVEDAEEAPLKDFTPLWEINDACVLIHSLHAVVDERTFRVMKLDAFDTLFAPKKFTVRVPPKKEDEPPGVKLVPAARAWREWEYRREAGAVTYRPLQHGEPVKRLTGEGVHATFNLWPGWGCEPNDDGCPLFLALIDHLFTGADPGAKEWFLQWLAYPLQYPGIKLYSAVVFWSLRTGIGKSLVGEIMGRIYGKNFVKIGNKQLRGSHNTWQENRQFVLGDEITGSDKRELADQLKDMITQSTVEINTKFIPQYFIPDCMNYLFTSNHPDSFMIEDDDRRLFVHEITVPKLEPIFYNDLVIARDSACGPDSPGSIMRYLLDLDVSSFGANEPAFTTSAKRSMINDSKGDVDTWVALLKHDPDAMLRSGAVPSTKDIFSSAELLPLFDTSGDKRLSPQRLAAALRRAGFRQVNDNSPVRTAAGLDRYYAVRNTEHWLKASHQELAAHLEGKVSAAKRSKY